MKTKVICADKKNGGEYRKAIDLAVSLLKSGEIAAVPTETVYGLAADAQNPDAVKKIFKAKGRPQDNPLIVHISSFDQLERAAHDIPEKVFSLTRDFWPGPLTVVLKKNPSIPDVTSGGLDTAAFRMPSHPVIRDIIKTGDILIAAPSANISGRPSGTNAADVFSDFNGLIPLILDGGVCDIGVESTVISFVSETPVLLRPGFVTVEDIESRIGKIDISPAVLGPVKSGEKAMSPGMKYKHYSPDCDVFLVKGSSTDYRDFVKKNDGCGVFALCFDGEQPIKNSLCYGKENDFAEQAKNIFSALRQLDKAGAKTVYVHCPNPKGVALATYNRLIRAAAFKIIEL